MTKLKQTEGGAVQCQIDAGDGRWSMIDLPASDVEDALSAGYDVEGPWAVAADRSLRVAASAIAPERPAEQPRRAKR